MLAFGTMLLVGFAVGFLVVWAVSQQTRRKARRHATEVIRTARREAALSAHEIRQKAEEENAERLNRINRELDRREIEVEIRLREIRTHEESISFLDHQLEQRSERLTREGAAIKQAREAIRELSRTLRKRLEGTADMDIEEIKASLRREVAIECEDELRGLRRATMERSEQDLANQARWMLVTAMQRLATKPNSDITATIVQLPNEEMKGRIIGREGRNIKSFELATGVTLLIDETPQMALISSFDPVRREVARIALEELVKDGRIHPSSIEEAVKEAKEEVEGAIQKAGDDAVLALGINGLHPEIVKTIGRLKYRFSYTQNSLEHSVEVGFLCSMLASELGLDPALAKRAGLLHDIGKAVPADMEGSHALIGAEFIKRYGETPVIVNAVAAHHEELPSESLYAGLVMVADKISATRPGARSEPLGNYLQRIEKLETMALVIEGVQQAYAIQAGREVRILVNPETVSDDRAREIARLLRQRIESELQYPSTIKITVVRETRFNETAT